jgi:tRNA threonylcarbamoyladenosine biosynthesis protein TsaE
MSSNRTSMKSLAVELRIPTSDVMEELGGLVYLAIDDETSPTESGAGAGAGAVICLDGDLGAGKTAFSRGFVRAATGDWSLRVTSPTYLLSNAYRTSRSEYVHAAPPI